MILIMGTLMRKPSTHIAIFMTPSPWQMSKWQVKKIIISSRGFDLIHAQEFILVLDLGGETARIRIKFIMDITSGSRTFFSSKQHHSISHIFFTNSLKTIGSKTSSRIFKTRNLSMKFVMISLAISMFIFKWVTKATPYWIYGENVLGFLWKSQSVGSQTGAQWQS